jgi:hypothetical protein
LVLAVLVLALWVADIVQRGVRAPQQSPHVAAVQLAASAASAAGARASEAVASAPVLSEPRAPERAASGAVGLATGSTDWASLAPLAALAALLLLLAGWLRSSGARLDRLKVALGGVVRTADSPQFMWALSLWKPAVRLYDPTPRGLKRFCNRARLFAIHESTAHPEADTQEVHVVALTAIHHVNPRMLDDIAAVLRDAGSNGLREWLRTQGDRTTAATDAELRRCLELHLGFWDFADAATVERFSQLLGQISVR